MEVSAIVAQFKTMLQSTPKEKNHLTNQVFILMWDELPLGMAMVSVIKLWCYELEHLWEQTTDLQLVKYPGIKHNNSSRWIDKPL